ncbi:MAG: DUF4202 domain-containing protein [Gammaproteobacteria bacterium]|nr:DUF4202 domain-containing protein [Gammaproteobacteria bacterium]MCW8986595.1 DUF4202 domain-containing protein [Gammaproteobacteria bacterium]MCW9029955.1 DUF4202 domain-containing protein [Gammaproteobacteria bacterium]
MTQHAFEQAVTLMDAANSEDPNIETADGKEWPKELLYSHRMAEMLERYKPEADHVVQLAIRGQHIQRWKSPRDAYPMDRKGYHQWRTQLYTFHAETTAELMAKAGFDDASLERVRQAVGKKGIKTNADTQVLEDVAALVFIEHYMLAFAEKHPEYDEAKWIDIIRKTWRKMTEDGHEFALSGKLVLPEPLVPLIQKALAAD